MLMFKILQAGLKGSKCKSIKQFQTDHCAVSYVASIQLSQHYHNSETLTRGNLSRAREI